MTRKKRTKKVAVKKGNFLKENYRQSWNYIKESRNFIYAILIIFVMFILIGFFVPVPEVLLEEILSFIEELLRKTGEMSHSELIRFIFFNNLQSSFSGMIFGIVLGIFPVVTIIANGYLLGFVSSRIVQTEGIFILWRLLPHGIFELPALLISVGLGLKLGFWLIAEPIKFYWKKNKLISFLFILLYPPTLIITLIVNKKFNKKMISLFHKFKINLWNSLRVFLFVIIPLLLIAAIIEGSLIFFLK